MGWIQILELVEDMATFAKSLQYMGFIRVIHNFDLDFVYQPIHKAWKSTIKPSICNITNIFNVVNGERHPNLLTFTQNRIVHKQSNDNEFSKNLDSSKVVFSWRGDCTMEVNCRTVSLST